MLTARDIMTKEVVTVTTDTGLKDLAKLLSRRGTAISRSSTMPENWSE